MLKVKRNSYFQKKEVQSRLPSSFQENSEEYSSKLDTMLLLVAIGIQVQ